MVVIFISIAEHATNGSILMQTQGTWNANEIENTHTPNYSSSQGDIDSPAPGTTTNTPKRLD